MTNTIFNLKKIKMIEVKENQKSQVPKEKKAVRAWFKRNIDLELFNEWQRHKRSGDVKKLVEFTKKSPPTIVRALNYGYCSKPDLKDQITNYFIMRNENEKKQVELLRRSAGEPDMTL
jgi:hypothetical protein